MTTLQNFHQSLVLVGTGKTTVARKIGKVYFDMGFLSSDEVIDCSATDLVGQYVGHTGPKVQKMFDKALGKVSKKRLTPP